MGSIQEANIKGKTIIGGTPFYKVASRSHPGHFHYANKDYCPCIGNSVYKHCRHRELCKCVRCLGAGSCVGDVDGCYWCGGTGDAR